MIMLLSVEISVVYGTKTKIDKIREELVDVLNYCILMADACGVDMDEIIVEKVKRNGVKYPVEKAKDSAKKYDEF